MTSIVDEFISYKFCALQCIDIEMNKLTLMTLWTQGLAKARQFHRVLSSCYLTVFLFGSQKEILLSINLQQPHLLAKRDKEIIDKTRMLHSNSWRNK